ncbi:MAG TPA: phosphonate ABC transporter ATP-binding protein [Rhizobiaceae bacterium]|nr:phosphonate ABC transporter ATP-binding protein [Rhizobiaceae bacterium]
MSVMIAATARPNDQRFCAEPVLQLSGLGLHYPNGKQALSDASLEVDRGEFVVVLGSNGSGKSSMLRCIVRLLEPTSGTITVARQDMIRLQGSGLRRARMSIGMVSQHANLVRRRSVLANVMCGALARHNGWRTTLGILPREEAEPALQCLEHVGLADLARQRADTLSGGQAQRVAVARALAQRPQLMLADEPVASLDPEAAGDVMKLLRRLADEGLAVMCVLHQPQLAQRHADRVIGLSAGRVVFETRAGSIKSSDIDQLYGKRAA